MYEHENDKAPAEPVSYEIYQLKDGDINRDRRFVSIDSLMEQGMKPEFDRYDLVYKGDFAEFEQQGGTIGKQLEAVYRKFNLEHPEDFKGHSLSVSDVVVAKGKPYYVDTFGFKELKAFSPAVPEREKTAEQEKKQQKKAKR